MDKRTATGSNSATAHRNHHFQLVAITEHRLSMLAARHDFAILFDGNAFTGEFEDGNKFGNGERGIELARLAIDGKRNHGVGIG